MKKLSQPVFGKNVRIGTNVHIDPDVWIGEGTVVEPNSILRNGTRLGKDSYIGPGCIIGERTRNYYANPKNYRPKPCMIGKKSVLRAGTLIYADVTIGDFFETGPYVTIREKTAIGHHSRFGNFTDIQGYCRIGNYVSGHSNVTIGQNSTVEDFVWLHPFVILINDLYPPTSLEIKGPHIGKYSVLGAGAMIFPGIKLKEHVIVAAQAAVRKNVAAYQLVSGQPACEVGDCRKMVVKVKGRTVTPYPWMQHRSQGYPWAKGANKKH